MTVITDTRLPARDEFPLVDKVLYLNGSFQQPLSRSVKEACVAQLESHFSTNNPKAQWYDQATRMTRKMAAFINAPSNDSVCFVKNTSEGLNHVIHAMFAQWPKGSNVVILDGEHPNQVYAWKSLERQGLEVRRIPQINHADAATFVSAVDENTRAIGISWIMFHSGQRNDIQDLCDTYRPRGIQVLIDATQGVGVAKLDLGAIKPSAVAFGCHKALGTPAGLGVLYIEPGLCATLKPTYLGPSGITDCPPTFIAGHAIDNLKPGAGRFDAGNLNYLALHGCEAYLDLIESVGGIERIEDYLYALSQEMIDGLANLGVETVASPKRCRRSPHNVVFKLKDQGWVAHLANRDCLVIHYRDGMRVSLGIYNNQEDVNRFVAIIKEGLDQGIPAR